MAFKVGDKVICVYHSGLSPLFWTFEKDHVFTVSAVDNKNFNIPVIYIGFIMFEIDQPMAADRFRKVEPKNFTNEITRELSLTEIVEERIDEPQPQEV